MAMSPVEVVLSIIPTLSERDKKKVRELLGTGSPPYVRPCAKSGHNYKQVGIIKGRWFVPEQKKMTCTRCGDTITV